MKKDSELKQLIVDFYKNSNGYVSNHFALEIIRHYIYDLKKIDIVNLGKSIYIDGINDIEYINQMFNISITYFENKYEATKIIETKNNKIIHIYFNS